MIALTRTPSANIQACQRTFVPNLPIDYRAARQQHAAYCEALRSLGCEVQTLDASPDLPDCAFIEDTAVVLDEVAVLASMGTASRKPEPAQNEPVLREFREIERIPPEASLEGGDVLRVGRTLLVGRSRRTNTAGIQSLVAIGSHYGYEVIPLPVRHCLHLKTACTALPDGRLLLNPAWVDPAVLARFDAVHIAESEPWAANVVCIGNTVLTSAASVQTAEIVRRLGFDVTTVDLSEFAKAEGAVTCLSLLFS